MTKMKIKTKLSGLRAISLFGDAFSCMAFYIVGERAGRGQMTVAGLLWFAGVFGAAGLKLLASSAENKFKTTPVAGSSANPYRDPAAGLHARVVELEKENKELAGKQPFPWENAILAALAGMVILTLGIAVLHDVAYPTHKAAASCVDGGADGGSP